MIKYTGFEEAYEERQADVPSPSLFLQMPGLTRKLAELGVTKKAPKGTVLVKPGDAVDHCYVVRRGCVIAYDISAAGNERVHYVALDHSLILEVYAILGRPSPVFFKAVKNTEFVAIPRNVLVSEIRRSPGIALTVIESLCRKFSSVTEQLREIKCHEAAWRLCNLFLIFAKTYGEADGSKTLIREKINQQMLADILSINRITTVRLMSALKSRGLIEKNGSFYCIPDRQEFLSYMKFLETREMKDN
jgi:CRP-like cAMP-binding protein